MTLWWLQPGWKDAECHCGCNIWDSGGDPDMGVCYDHVTGTQDEPEPPMPRCDVCGTNEAVAGINGYGVCSEECGEKAKEMVHP